MRQQVLQKYAPVRRVRSCDHGGGYDQVRVRVRVRVRKWDVHIQCDQHFQLSVFEILVLFSFDLVFGPVE